MSKHNPGNSREARAASILCLAFAVALGASLGPKGALADSPPVASDDSPVEPAVVRDLEADLVVLFDKVSADLDARIATKTDSIAQQAADEQVAALLQRAEQEFAARNPVPRRAGGRPIPTYVVRAEREEPADLSKERSIKIARGSLEISRPNAPAGQAERVEHGHYRFEHPFTRGPVVALGVRLGDRAHPNLPRVAIRVVRVDETGFDYEVRNQDDAPIEHLTADWVAYAPVSLHALHTSAP